MFERLTVILYDKSSPLSSVNQTRKDIFCLKNQSIERMPPTQDALLHKYPAAVYQARIWTTSLQTQQMVPSPQEFAWAKVSESWQPVWVTLTEVSKACQELIKC
ncbi:hypothetical protein LSAT2_023843, partial [Lamellibrachia satsuma]